MFGVAYDAITGQVIGTVLKDAELSNNELRGSNGRIVTDAFVLMFSEDPGALENINDLTEETILEGIKEYQCACIRARSNAIMTQLKQGYTEGEIDSWDRQQKGAADIINGNTTTENAVYVTALANARIATGDSTLTLLTFAQKIQANFAAATNLGIATLGRQQGLEAAIRKATTPEMARLITW